MARNSVFALCAGSKRREVVKVESLEARALSEYKNNPAIRAEFGNAAVYYEYMKATAEGRGKIVHGGDGVHRGTRCQG